MFWVYMLRCKDGSLYTGYTNNLKKRLEKHNLGLGAKYTRGRLPAVLVWAKPCKSKSVALVLEIKIKGLKKAQKEKLCANWRRGPDTFT